MPEQEIARSIRFPKRLWDALDEDAKRCRRSSLKQMEALLTVYYDLDSIDIEKDKFPAAPTAVKTISTNSNIPVRVAKAPAAKKKRVG